MPVAEMRLLSFDFDEFIWEHTGQTLSTANQFKGVDPFEFSIDMAQEADKNHIFGGRMYYEVFFNSGVPGQVVTEIQPGFLDILGYNPGTKNYGGLTGGEIAGIVIAVLAVVAIIVIIVICCIKKRRGTAKTHSD